MFPPLDFLEARDCAAPVEVVSGTNTEKRIETLLPVSRGYAVTLLQRKTRRNAPRLFHDATFLRNQLAAASGMSRCRFMTILLSAPR
jgi:hypothetical protein